MQALRMDIPSDGALEAKGRYAMRAASLDTLFEHPEVDASFAVRKGSLSGLDFVRALQAPSREDRRRQDQVRRADRATSSLAARRYQYSSVRLQAGLLTATGQLRRGADRGRERPRLRRAAFQRERDTATSASRGS